jgi:hypothetical protein
MILQRAMAGANKKCDPCERTLDDRSLAIWAGKQYQTTMRLWRDDVMWRRAILRGVTLVLGGVVLLACGDKGGETIRFSHHYPQYAELLQRHVDANGWVDYEGLIADSALLRQAITAVGSVPADSLKSFTTEQQVAFWINTFNLLTLRAVVDAYPMESIQEIKGAFDEQPYRIAGRQLTLDDIENKILRQLSNDPRFHFALVRASVSSPALRREPYLADSLTTQLREATWAFLTDSTRNRFSPGFREAHLSPIFEKFGRDFETIYGSAIPSDHPPELRAALNFIAEVLPDSLGRFLREDSVLVDFTAYDWGLNSQKAARLRSTAFDTQ